MTPRRCRSLPGLAALLLTALLAVTPAAAAQDAIAPPGAPPMWLPPYDWVLNHHFPYDVAKLYRVLRTDDAELRAFFGGQAHAVVPPIAGLARQRGVSFRRLNRLLVRPWRGRVSSRHLRSLRRRITLTLTQGHLLQHMLFHPLHEKALMEAEPEIFGADHMSVAALRRTGMSNLEIGASYGRTEEEITAAARGVLRRTMRRAVRARWTPAAQGRRYLRIQFAAIPAWLAFAGKSADGTAQDDHTHDAMGEAAAAAISSRAACGRAAC